MGFEKVAPYLQDPLVLAGFALTLFFGLGRAILKARVIPQLTQIAGYRALQRLLLYGFLLSIVIVMLGFGLKYRELSRREQLAAAHQILEELKADRGVAGSLAANSATSLETTSELALALRSDASPLLKIFFPPQNLQPTDDTPAPSAMAHQRLALAISSGLPEQQAQLDRMNLVAGTIRGTIDRTRSAMGSLADLDGKRYRIQRTAWIANSAVIRRISAVDLTRLERTYSRLEQTRANYDVMLRYNIRYLDTLGGFLAFKNNGLSEEELARVLATERQYFTVAAAYGHTIADSIDQSNQAIKELESNLPKG